MDDVKYISCAETAKLIRKVLKENFPGMKFSVRSSSYAGGAHIDIRWVDGPTRKSVEFVTDRFQGARFDSSIDLQSYVESEWQGEQVHFGADSVLCHRKMSRQFIEAIAEQFCTRFGLPFEIKGNDQDAWLATRLDHSQEHWFNDLLNKTDVKDRYRAYAAKEAQEAREHAEYMAGERARRAKAQQEQEAWEREEVLRQKREQQQRAKREREAREQGKRQQEQRQRSAFQFAQQQVLATPQSARLYLKLPPTATRTQVLQAFRESVKAMADGKGGYRGDMDFLVKVKEKALQ